MQGERIGVSASAIDKLMRRYRHRGVGRPFSATKPGSLLKSAIPIRTFAEWGEWEKIERGSLLMRTQFIEGCVWSQWDRKPKQVENERNQMV